MFFLEVFIVTFLGLVLGSFSTALAYRVPRKVKWGAERSACPSCNHVLGVLDLVPFFSWCVFFGKCRHCSTKISFRYPLTELTSAVMCLGIYAVFGLSIEALIVIACVPILLALFVIDLEHMILPNQLVLILACLGLLRLVYILFEGGDINLLLSFFVLGSLVYAFIPWLIGVVMTKILRRDSLGFGDVKFFAVAGLWLGTYHLPYYFIISGALAILFSLGWRFIKKTQVFPFGPALIASLISSSTYAWP